MEVVGKADVIVFADSALAEPLFDRKLLATSSE